MTHVPGAVDIVEPAGAAEVVFVARPEGGVVETAQVWVEKTVKGGWVGDLFGADALDLLCRVGEESHG